MNCNNIETFYREWHRMCDSFVCEDSWNCPLQSKEVVSVCTRCTSDVFLSPTEAVKAVQEWSDKHPRQIDWTKVPVNTLVQVTNDHECEIWIDRYFCGYIPQGERGKYITYSEGKRRENATDIGKWHHCKLPPNVDPTPYLEGE
ncbi:MAG: hypothetical protein IKY67_06395 [Paludibacteraceae bacterium]|nr:hypothetical protein [Paludibacteraceae bacterium]